MLRSDLGRLPAAAFLAACFMLSGCAGQFVPRPSGSTLVIALPDEEAAREPVSDDVLVEAAQATLDAGLEYFQLFTLPGKTLIRPATPIGKCSAILVTMWSPRDAEKGIPGGWSAFNVSGHIGP